MPHLLLQQRHALPLDALRACVKADGTEKLFVCWGGPGCSGRAALKGLARVIQDGWMSVGGAVPAPAVGVAQRGRLTTVPCWKSKHKKQDENNIRAGNSKVPEETAQQACLLSPPTEQGTVSEPGKKFLW